MAQFLHVLEFAESRRPELLYLLGKRKARAATIRRQSRGGDNDGVEGGQRRLGLPSTLRRLRRRTTSHRRRKGRSIVAATARKGGGRGGTASSSTTTATAATIPPVCLTRARRRRLEMAGLISEQKGKPKRLETHIWHAKRMKMEVKWGYHLSTSATRKPSKTTIKAIRYGSTLHDASYTQVLQFKGQREVIVAFLGLFMDVGELPILTKPEVLIGTRMGEAMLYHQGSFPQGPLAPFRFLWRSSVVEAAFKPGVDEAGEEEEESQLWLFIHPSAAGEVVSCFQAVLGNGSPSSSSSGWPITMTSVSDLRLFELRGSASHKIAQRVLNSSDSSSSPEPSDGSTTTTTSAVIAAAVGSTSERLWNGLLRHLITPSHLPLGSLLALSIKDPREWNDRKEGKRRVNDGDDVTSHQKKAKTEKKKRAELKVLTTREWPTTVCQSALWVPEIREVAWKRASQERTDAVLNAERQERRKASTWLGGLLAEGGSIVEDTRPGMAALAAAEAKAKALARSQEKKEAEALIPVLLIARGGQQEGEEVDSERYPGYDLIVPKGWARILWHAFIRAGVRPIGIHDKEQMAVEIGQPSFPRDYPETQAGQKFWLEQIEQEKETQKKRPPRKRRPVPVMDWSACGCQGGSGTSAASILAEKKEEEENGKGAEGEAVGQGFSMIRRREYMEPAILLSNQPYQGSLLPPASSHQMLKKRKNQNGRRRRRKSSSSKMKVDGEEAVVSMEEAGTAGDVGGEGRDKEQQQQQQQMIVDADIPLITTTTSPTISELAPLPFPTFVRVQLQCSWGGKPESYAEVFLPCQSDYEAWKKGNSPTPTTMSLPSSPSSLEKERPLPSSSSFSSTPQKETFPSSASPSLLTKKKETPCSSLSQPKERQKIGYITSGCFSSSHGCGLAVGLVSVNGLRRLQILAAGLPPSQAECLMISNPRSDRAWPAKATILVV